MSDTRDIQNVALIGFMGCGKTTVGHLVAAYLHFGFVDTDQLIEARAGKSIPAIFAEGGESAFRELERQVVEELAGYRKMVIATGGGLGANPAHLASLKAHSLVFCLWSSFDTIWRRVRNSTHRPLLQDPNPQAKIRRLLAERSPVYRQADVLISTDLRSPPVIAQQIIFQFHLPTSGKRSAMPRPPIELANPHVL